MRESLKRRCDLQIQNEACVRKAARFEYDEVSKLAALIITSKGAVADEARIRDCRALLKKQAGIFSNWRGIMNTVVLAKMSLADDPLSYFEGVQGVYEMLTAKTLFKSEYQSMCAMMIYELCQEERRDEVCAKTIEQYQAARKAHPFLTGHEDLSVIALMVLAGLDPAEMLARAEECFELLKPLLNLHPETRQMTSNILALSDKPSSEKVEILNSLHEGLTEAKHPLSKNRTISILAAYVDVEARRKDLIDEICEVDDYLKGQKGYGILGVGKSFRRLMASVMVLFDHDDDVASQSALASGTAIVEVVAEQIVEAIIMLIVIMSVQNASRASSN